jgi:multicomponent Na+:H+ antiporter subunit F
MTVAFDVALALLAVAGMLCVARLVRGGLVADRIIALDTLVLVIVTGIAVGAVRAGGGVFLDLLVVAALLGFVATAMVARYIEGRGTDE